MIFSGFKPFDLFLHPGDVRAEINFDLPPDFFDVSFPLFNQEINRFTVGRAPKGLHDLVFAGRLVNNLDTDGSAFIFFPSDEHIQK
jgi:hypothetical protein